MAANSAPRSRSNELTVTRFYGRNTDHVEANDPVPGTQRNGALREPVRLWLALDREPDADDQRHRIHRPV